MQDKIQIGIPCGPNCEGYLMLTMEAAIKTAKNPERLEFLLALNHQTENIPSLMEAIENFKKKDFCKSKVTVLDLRHPPAVEEFSSLAHGVTMNMIVENMTEKYGLLADVDMVITYKDWDEIFTNLIDNKVIIVGAASELQSKSKYDNFPTTYWALFDVEKFKSMNLDLRPLEQRTDINVYPQSRPINEELVEKVKFLGVENAEQLASFMGKNPGDIIKFDTGFEVPIKIRLAGYDGIHFKSYGFQQSSFVRGVFHDRKGDPQEFRYNGDMCLTHLKACSIREYNGKSAQSWKNLIKAHLSNKYGIVLEV